jgi:hypothetical protein
MHDAHMGRFDVAVVVSNDSDLLEPIKIVRGQLGKKVGVLNPHPKPSRALLPHIDFIKQIGLNLYGAFGVKRFSASSAQSPILFKSLCSVGEPFLCPGLHQEVSRAEQRSTLP